MMRKGVNEHERIVLICSKASLDRKGVLNEIEESLTREAREGSEAYWNNRECFWGSPGVWRRIQPSKVSGSIEAEDRVRLEPRKTKSMNDAPLPQSDFIFYQTEDGRTRIQCRFEDETLWLTQAQIAELFQISPQNVTLHLKAIFAEGELTEVATCKDYLQVRWEGAREVSRPVLYYNLSAILAVGYRVRSHRGTQFRQWATTHLQEYLVKGFTMDDERLKNPPGKGHIDYFDELLERIRDIRASERRVYLRVRDILALAADYQARWQLEQNLMVHLHAGRHVEPRQSSPAAQGIG